MRAPDEKQELQELWDLYRSQERELNEMRIRLSRFMTKGAPVFAQPSELKTKTSGEKAQFRQHVHFSSSLTNGSSEERKSDESIRDAVDEAGAKVHKGSVSLHQIDETSSQPIKSQNDVPISAKDTKKTTKKKVVASSGYARPKSSKPAKKGRLKNKPEDELVMETEEESKDMGKAKSAEKVPSQEESPSADYGSHPSVEMKHSLSKDTDPGADDTSKDFTSLSAATTFLQP